MPARVLLLTIDGAAVEDVARPLAGRNLDVTVARDPGAALQHLAAHQLVIIDTPDEATLALLCRRINDTAGSNHPPILAIAHSGDVGTRIRLLEAGADDVLARPVDERELEALVEALLLRSPAAAASSETALAMPGPVAGGQGKVIAFLSAKGGSGTTTLAVNTALVLAASNPGRVALADLDMYHGQVTSHLDVYPRTSTAELARESREELNPEVFHETGRQHASGLTVFGGPYRPDDAWDITAAQLAALVDHLAKLYGTVVIDLGSVLDLRALGVIERADVVALVLAPDIPSLRLLHASLQLLSESGASDKAVFVVNHVYPRPMISGDQIEDHIGIKVGLEVPHDGAAFLKAINEGQPVVVMAPQSTSAAAIRRLAASLSEGEAVELEPVAAVTAGAQRRPSLLRGLLSRE